MFGIMPLVPAYGRDYKNKAAVEKDFLDGKDFRTCAGSYCSVRDFGPGTEITIRYAKLRKVHIFRIGGGA